MTESQAHKYTDDQLRQKIAFNIDMLANANGLARATRLRRENDMLKGVLAKRGAFMAKASQFFRPANASFAAYVDVIRRGEY